MEKLPIERIPDEFDGVDDFQLVAFIPKGYADHLRKQKKELQQKEQLEQP